jgi:methionyl-tRNA synthetase
MAKKFYLTTPIYYVNARPHIGHAYSTIVADVLARRHRLLGDDTYFLTGTDEHGQKIERAAAAAGIPPQQYADQVSKTFSDLWSRMGITHNQFIRTTDSNHKRGVQKLFTDLFEKGQIYLSTYTGSYCVSDEAFVDAPVGTPCPDCGRLLESVTEENFFFRLSDYQDKLIALIESNELRITPDSSRNEVLSFVRSGLKDLSISRSSFTWGIPVPEEIQAAAGAKEKHVIYVWLDALANYMTALGYGSPDDTLWQAFWPADLHLVGKEITRFHCIYWPAFLLAAGLPLPKQVTANGWLLFDNSKMSKSKGNVVRTETILDAFGTLCPPPLTRASKDTPASALLGTGFSPSVTTTTQDSGALAPEGLPSKADRDLFAADILRYYLLREIPFGQDGSFSFDSMITRYNADLANGYGNLVSRVLTMISKNFDGAIPDGLDHRDPSLMTTEKFSAALSGPLHEFENHFEANRFHAALEWIAQYIGGTDQTLSNRAPWKLKGAENRDELAAILYTSAEAIRIVTVLLYPFLPYATTRVWEQLGLANTPLTTNHSPLTTVSWGALQPGTKLGPLTPIFPRADKGLAQIMTDMEENKLQTPNSKLQTGSQNTPPPEARSPQPAAGKHNPPSSDPAAGPRTASIKSLDGTTGPLPVGGSTATTTHNGPTPSHTEAHASGIFATPPAAPASTEVTIDDFAKIELRVAQILVAERIPKADKLLRLEVDLGPLGTRQILSGIAEFYTPEDLLHRKIVVITNLAPRKMRGLESHGMLLAASDDTPDGVHGKPILATFAEDIPNGTRLK